MLVRCETAYPVSAAGARVRICQFAPFLKPHGVVLEHHPTLNEREYALLSSHASTVRKARILAVATSRTIRSRRPANEKLLVHRLRLLHPLPGFDPPARLDFYDLDDALFVDPDGRSGRTSRWIKREAPRCIHYLRNSQLTIAGNSFLADRARDYTSRVEVVPTCVDPSQQALRVHEPSPVLTVGWIGSRSTSRYLETILPAFARFNRGSLRARLVLVGADPLIAAPWIEHRGWSVGSVSRDLTDFDVGVMPMPASEWARGKCGYKVLQYFSAGVPAIASPVGVAPTLLAEGRGILASTETDWANALHVLMDDVLARRERGLAARKFVESHYSYQAWSAEFARILLSCDSP